MSREEAIAAGALTISGGSGTTPTLIGNDPEKLGEFILRRALQWTRRWSRSGETRSPSTSPRNPVQSLRASQARFARDISRVTIEPLCCGAGLRRGRAQRCLALSSRAKAITQKLDRLDDDVHLQGSRFDLEQASKTAQRSASRGILTYKVEDRPARGSQGRGKVRRRGRPELCGAGATACLGFIDTGVVGATAAASTTVFFRKASRSAEKHSIEPS